MELKKQEVEIKSAIKQETITIQNDINTNKY